MLIIKDYISKILLIIVLQLFSFICVLLSTLPSKALAASITSDIVANIILLKDINIKSISDQEINIFLRFNNDNKSKISAPTVTKNDNFLVLSFNNAGVKLDKNTIEVKHKLVNKVNTEEVNNKLNLMIEIKPGAFYTIKQKANIYAIIITADKQAQLESINKEQSNSKNNPKDNLKDVKITEKNNPQNINQFNPANSPVLEKPVLLPKTVERNDNKKKPSMRERINSLLPSLQLPKIKPAENIDDAKPAALPVVANKSTKTEEVNKEVLTRPMAKEEPNTTFGTNFDKAMIKGKSDKKENIAKITTVENIDFGLTNDNIAKITVTFSNDKITNTVDDSKNYKKILQFVFKDLSLPNKIDKIFDVSDFGTIVQKLSWEKNHENNTVTLNIISKSTVEYVAYQLNNQLIIEIKDKLSISEDSIIKNKEYFGKKISLNFQNIELRSVLQILADFTDLNLVASDSIHGNLSLRLMNVPWDQALEIVLKTKNLDKRKYGNILMIAPSNEIFELEKNELESEHLVEKLIGLKTEYFYINYAKSEDIAKLITNGAKGSILSERGKINFDNRTNMLIIQDTPKKLKEVREILKTLDTPVKQVLIEARIVRASTNFQKELGVRWGLSAKRTSNNYKIGVGDTSPNAAKILPSGSSVMSPKSQSDIKANAGDTGFNIDLGLADPTSVIGLALAKLPGSTLVHLELSALEAEGVVETISSPKIITANKVAAKIEQGKEIPYQQASSSGATNVAFKKVVLSLTVTPQITPDNRIVMDIKVNNDTPDFTNKLSDNIPIIDTQQVETQVLVDNNQTIVLGGIFTQSLSNKIEKVPFFGNLPFVGRLFRNDQVDDERSEFLIFITPKIVADNS